MMTSEEDKQKQATLDDATIFSKLQLLEEKQKTMEERILKAEVLIDSVSTGQQIIYSSLEGAGLMKNGEPVKVSAWDPDKILWVQAEGAKGPYERYPAQGQKAESSEDYKAILVDLKAHNGRMTKDGYFYWVFQDGATVGRKPHKGKETKPQAAKTDVETVKAKFPSELAELLTFTVEEK